MIVGNGMLANAFVPHYLDDPDTCIYASGVSNSRCFDNSDFLRERTKLLNTLAESGDFSTFVYFGTCSVNDPTAIDTAYVQHKIAMEKLVSAHPGYLIFRLPQIAAKTGNPNNLLNALNRHLTTGLEFTMWCNAYRNIIDIDDVLSIALRFLADHRQRKNWINIANPRCTPIGEVVAAMERAVGATMNIRCVDRGAHYPIDVSPMLSSGYAAHCQFDVDYIERVIAKYYAK
jgi:nucleoside-diphosphate-sugar epimerase